MWGRILYVLSGVLQGTELRGQTDPRMQIFAEIRRLSQIHPRSWKFGHLEGIGQKTADFCRKLKIFVHSCGKLQIGVRPLGQCQSP